MGSCRDEVAFVVNVSGLVVFVTLAPLNGDPLTVQGLETELDEEDLVDGAGLVAFLAGENVETAGLDIRGDPVGEEGSHIGWSCGGGRLLRCESGKGGDDWEKEKPDSVSPLLLFSAGEEAVVFVTFTHLSRAPTGISDFFFAGARALPFLGAAAASSFARSFALVEACQSSTVSGVPSLTTDSGIQVTSGCNGSKGFFFLLSCDEGASSASGPAASSNSSSLFRARPPLPYSSTTSSGSASRSSGTMSIGTYDTRSSVKPPVLK